MTTALTAPKTVTKARATAAQAEAKAREERFRTVQRAAILLKQASDPTRLQVLLMLAEGEKHVGALCDALNQTQPAVSHHLALCRHGGLIVPRRDGKHNFYSNTDAGNRLARVARELVEG